MTFDEWYEEAELRPLTPKGRIKAAWIAATSQCIDIAEDHCCQTWAECCDCKGIIVKEILATGAQ